MKLPTLPWPIKHDVIGEPRRPGSARARAPPAASAAGDFSRARSRPIGRRSSSSISSGLTQDCDDGAGKDEVAGLLRQDRKRSAEPGEDEGKLADLREATPR